jgi:hypothetical protein
MKQNFEKFQEALSKLQNSYGNIHFLREAKNDLFMLEFELLRLYCEKQESPSFRAFESIEGLKSLYLFLDDLEKADIAQVS